LNFITRKLSITIADANVASLINASTFIEDWLLLTCHLWDFGDNDRIILNLVNTNQRTYRWFHLIRTLCGKISGHLCRIRDAGYSEVGRFINTENNNTATGVRKPLTRSHEGS